MATEQKENTGFSLPEPKADAAAAAVPVTPSPAGAAAIDATTLQPVVNVTENTASRDLLIGGAILLVLFVAFFFAKNAYANGLVSKKLPPDRANASGWWLFIFLATLATGVVLVAVNSARFMAPLVMGPVAVVSLAALVLTFTSSRR